MIKFEDIQPDVLTPSNVNTAVQTGISNIPKLVDVPAETMKPMFDTAPISDFLKRTLKASERTGQFIQDILNYPANYAEQRTREAGYPKAAPVVGFLVGMMTPMPGDEEMFLSKKMYRDSLYTKKFIKQFGESGKTTYNAISKFVFDLSTRDKEIFGKPEFAKEFKDLRDTSDAISNALNSFATKGDLLFHGTSKEAADDILKNGLLRSDFIKRVVEDYLNPEGAISLTPDRGFAELYGHPDWGGAILQTNASNFKLFNIDESNPKILENTDVNKFRKEIIVEGKRQVEDDRIASDWITDFKNTDISDSSFWNIAYMLGPKTVKKFLAKKGYQGTTQREGGLVSLFIPKIDPKLLKHAEDFPIEMSDFLKRLLKDEELSAKKGFEGFSDLTTKILEKLKGKATVSKQFISDLTNMPELKQTERDLVRNILQDEGNNISVPDFANKVKTELLPLKRSTNPATQYESIALPEELRGPVANYDEHIYQSPIKTSAKDTHFSNLDQSFDNYFAHTRMEDLPSDNFINSAKGKKPYEINMEGSAPGSTRRVIELQSDLFQKGRLDQEAFNHGKGMLPANEAKIADQTRQSGLSKLEPYRNTWHERIIREEVKQAAKDGKTKLQFPTGETAMKIEGLGENVNFLDMETGERLKLNGLEIGKEVLSGEVRGRDNVFIITDVLGDGKFKAVLKSEMKTIGDIAKARAENNRYLNRAEETFDISGKVDTSNPIYRFYEKEVGKYLKNKYNAQLVTDKQGVSWWQVDVPKEKANMPVEAFSVIPFLQNLIPGREINVKAPEQNQEQKTSTSTIKKALEMTETGVIPESKRYTFSRPSGIKQLGRALGKYQVTEGELKTYASKYLGRAVTAKEFLSNPALQDRYIEEKINRLRNEFGLTDEQIAGTHFGGLNANLENSGIKEYMRKFMEHLSKLK